MVGSGRDDDDDVVEPELEPGTDPPNDDEDRLDVDPDNVDVNKGRGGSSGRAFGRLGLETADPDDFAGPEAPDFVLAVDINYLTPPRRIT
jgi:hypothetical protein